jgi:hypothetical protein
MTIKRYTSITFTIAIAELLHALRRQVQIA